MASFFKKCLEKFLFTKKLFYWFFGIIFLNLHLYSYKICKNILFMQVYDIYFHKINQYYNLQKLKKMRKLHFFQLSSLITFKILQIGHFWGVLPPCFTSLAIRKIILRHPKCLQKNSRACFFPLVRCGRDGTENPSFTHLNLHGFRFATLFNTTTTVSINRTMLSL